MTQKSNDHWECYATVSVYPAEACRIDPIEVTSILGVDPFVTWRLGDLIKETGKERKYDIWIYKSKQPTSREPEAHVEEVLDVISPRWKRLKAKYQTIECKVDIVVYLTSSKLPPIIISSKNTKRAADANAKIGVDMYLIPTPEIGDDGICNKCGAKIAGEHQQLPKSQ